MYESAPHTAADGALATAGPFRNEGDGAASVKKASARMHVIRMNTPPLTEPNMETLGPCKSQTSTLQMSAFDSLQRLAKRVRRPCEPAICSASAGAINSVLKWGTICYR